MRERRCVDRCGFTPQRLGITNETHLSLALSLVYTFAYSFTFAHWFTHFLSFSLKHTHTHIHTDYLLSFSISFCLLKTDFVGRKIRLKLDICIVYVFFKQIKKFSRVTKTFRWRVKFDALKARDSLKNKQTTLLAHILS